MVKVTSMFFLSVALVAVVMYLAAQMMRLDSDAMGVVGTILALVGFFVTSITLNLLIPKALIPHGLGAFFGVAAGIYFDARWPAASDIEPNIWPIAIILWWAIGTPAVALGMYLAPRIRSKIWPHAPAV